MELRTNIKYWTAGTGYWMWSNQQPIIQQFGRMNSKYRPMNVILNRPYDSKVWRNEIEHRPMSATLSSQWFNNQERQTASTCPWMWCSPAHNSTIGGGVGGGWTAEAKNPHKGQVPTDMETITERCQRGYQPERPGKMAAVHHLQTEYWPLPSALLLAPPEDLSHQWLSKWNMSPRSQTHHAELPYQCTWKNMPASIWDRVEGQATRINWGARNHSPVHQEHQHLYLCHDHRTFEWRRRRRAASTVSWMWSSTAYEKQDEHRLMDVIFNSSWFNSLEI